jgi:hypothetical protein
MNEMGERLLESLRISLPGSLVYWEKEPSAGSLSGAVVSAEYRKRKFTMQFERADPNAAVEELDHDFIEQVVDDFTDFFSRTIYPKEKFTRMI